MGDSGFADRLRDVLIANGINSTDDLLGLCRRGGKRHLTTERIRAVLQDPERAPFGDVADLAAMLHVRPVYLVRGTGLSNPPSLRTETESALLELASRLTEPAAIRLIAIGWGMTTETDREN